MIEATRLSLGHDRVEILSEKLHMTEAEGGGLDSAVAYIQLTHVEPCIALEKGGQVEVVKEGMDDADLMNYGFHTKWALSLPTRFR